MKIRCFNDIHLFGVNPFMTADEMLSLAHDPNIKSYFLGDIVDIANAWKKDLTTARTFLQLLHENFPLVLGNHENNAINAPDFIYLNDKQTLLMHGDIAMWGKERSDKFRNGSPGAGWIKRQVVSKLIDSLRRYWTVRPNDRLREFIRAEKEKNPNLIMVIMGHSHPPRKIEFLESCVRCVILPRGYTDIEIA